MRRRLWNRNAIAVRFFAELLLVYLVLHAAGRLDGTGYSSSRERYTIIVAFIAAVSSMLIRAWHGRVDAVRRGFPVLVESSDAAAASEAA
jgi:hypothetical protein